MKRDYYEILGVDKNSDADAIKKSYRKLAMQYHPDRNPGNQEAEEKFKEAAEAYDVLSNPEKKAKYDRFGHQAFSGGGAGGFNQGFADMEDIFSSFGDIFGDFFGGATGGRQRRRNQPRRGADLRYVVEISLKDVVSGIEKQIEFDTEESCSPCSGSGAEKGSGVETCQTCHGSGQVMRAQGFFSVASPCPQCAGQGQIIKNPCKSCKGKGRSRSKRKIKLTIPPGVDNGTRLRVSNEGEGGYLGGPPGDLYVEVSVEEDDIFSRQNEHLICDLDVDYLTLLLGGEVEAPVVGGSKPLKIAQGTQVGDQLKMAGEGIPLLRGSRRGDIYYNIGVLFPKKLLKDEERLLKEIADLKGNKDSEKSGFWGKKK